MSGTENSTNYFVVEAKCGHVGRGRYIPICFPITARDAKRAAIIARQKPGVKHHQRDAILSVRKVNCIEYLVFNIILEWDLYWECARKYMAVLDLRVREEGYYYGKLQPDAGSKFYYKTNKIASRQFRVKRNTVIEMSIRRELKKEYGLSI